MTKSEQKTIEVTFRVPVTHLEGMEYPDKIRSCPTWPPYKHGVLLDLYMYWCKNHKGSKQEFAKALEAEVREGKHPLLEEGIEAITYYSIMSQLDWMAQKENQVITCKAGSTEKTFHPSNLMIMTTHQKAKEAQRARANKGIVNEDDSSAKELSTEPFMQALQDHAFCELLVGTMMKYVEEHS